MDSSDAAIDGVARKQASKLADNNKKDRFQIMAEHQPRDIAENAEAGYDLMLSGHTHAGQIWPVGLITSIFDKDTVNYGHVKYENMDLLVTSGIAGWGYPVRTGKRCEYVVINVKHI